MAGAVDSLAPERVEPLLRGRLGRPYLYREECESTQLQLDDPELPAGASSQGHSAPSTAPCASAPRSSPGCCSTSSAATTNGVRAASTRSTAPSPRATSCADARSPSTG